MQVIMAHNHNPEAKTCYVDKIKYSNHGGYTVAGVDLLFAEP